MLKNSLIIAALSVMVSAVAQRPAPMPDDIVQGEVLVKFKYGSSVAVENSYRTLGARPLEKVRALDVIRIKLPEGMSVAAAVNYYRSQPFVEFAEPNQYVHAFLIPNDPSFGSQWGMTKIEAPAAWDLNQGSSSVVVAIVDTGIDFNHPDLNTKLIGGWDYVNNDSVADDDNGHGTHCAGISAASTNNGIGVAGVGFNCRLMPVKVLNSAGSGTLTAVANGITFAADNGADVVSMSLGASSGSATLEAAVNYAWNSGCVVVAAAGNNGSTAPSYPAFYTNCIAVASTTSTDARSSFSNYGSSWVDVAAPGSSIYSTYDGATYATLSGTSMATPHVAGEAALLFSHLGPTTNTVVRQRIEQNCDNVETFVAFGRINVFKALTNSGGGGGGGGGTTVTDWAPTSFTMYRGSVTGGSLSSILSSDNSSLSMTSARVGSTRYIDWYVQTTANFTGNLTQLSAKIEANYSASGTMTCYMYNWGSAVWESVGSATIGTADTTATFNVTTSPSRFVSASNGVAVRFYRTRTSSFTMNTDQVVITTTTN